MESLKRIKKVINWLVFRDVIDSQNDLAALLGYSKCYVSQALNGHEDLSPRFVKKVCDLDPNLNSEWVLSGEGDMFSNNPFGETSADSAPVGDVVVDASVWEVLKRQSDSLSARDRQIDELVSLLRSEVAELKRGRVPQDPPVECADVG